MRSVPGFLLAAGLLAATPALAANPDFRSGTDVWVAASANAPGANQTVWSTDVWVQAPGAAAEVDAFFLPLGLDQQNTTRSPIHFSVPAGGQVALRDVVGAKFGLSNTSGALRFLVTNAASGAPKIVVTSRTFNNAAAGTYGQFIPGIPAGLARGASDPPAQIVGLKGSGDYRSNVGIVNVSAESDAVVTIEIRSRAGELLGSLTETFRPWTAKQYNRIFDIVGIAGEDSSRAIVKVSGGGRVLAYASIVDNRTGDPIYVPATDGR